MGGGAEPAGAHRRRGAAGWVHLSGARAVGGFLVAGCLVGLAALAPVRPALAQQDDDEPGVAVEEPVADDAPAEDPPEVAAPLPAPGVPTAADDEPEPLPVPRPVDLLEARDRPLALPPTEAVTPLPTERDLLARLEARAAMLRAGDVLSADLELGALEALREDLAVPSVPLAGLALAREARAELAAGRVEVAEARARAAVRLAPDLPAVHLTHARALVARDRGRPGAALEALAGAARAELRSPAARASLLAAAARWAGLGLLLAAGAFAAAQLARHGRAVAHDLAARAPSALGPAEAAALIACLLALPPLFGLGALPSLALGLAAVSGHQGRGERAAALALLVALGVTPLLARASSRPLARPGSLAAAIDEATSEAFAEDAEARLVAELEAGRGGAPVAMALGTRRRQRGDLAGAEEAYGRALAASPGLAAAENDRGAVRFLLGRREDAEASFRRAAAAGTLAEPWLNLATSVADGSRFDEARGHLERARSIDAALTARYAELDASVSPQRRILFAPRLAGGPSPGPEPEEARVIGDHLFARVGGRLPPLAMPALALGCALLGLGLAARQRGLSAPCDRCGRPAPRAAPAGVCDPCRAVFVAAAAVDPALRRAQEASVRSFQRRRRLLDRLLAVAPGAGDVLLGRAAVGLATLLVSGVALAMVLIPSSPLPGPGASAALARPLGAAVLAALAAVSLRKALGR
jgi:tetratricopeptide (TPR) repeat protein